MRLAADAALLSLGGVPMVGNLTTGGVIGLTDEGASLCRALSERDVPTAEVAPGCRELVEHLRRGGYLAGAERPAPGVTSAYLHVTQRCNLRCRFCYSKGDDRNRLPDPSPEQLARAIGLLAALGCQRLVISGGEPFLRDDLAQVASCAMGAGIGKVVVLTNGLLVDRAAIEPLAGLVSCVAVAFDGPDASSAAHLRGRQRFERLADAIGTIRDAGIEARILPTIHGRNVADMPRYRALADRLGASLGYSLLTGPPCELGDLSLSEGQLRELGRASVDDGLPHADATASEAAALHARRSCGAGSRTLSVAADGTVYPCHMLHVRRLAMGDAFVDAPEAIMSSKVAARFGALDVGGIEGCSACSVRHLCGGGCRARALMATGSLTGRDPYCELSRSHLEGAGERLRRRFGRRGGERHAV